MAISLYPYQVEYLNNLPKNIIMSAEVGTGKTIMAMEHFKRHNATGRLLVVAPASKVRTGDWQREVERYFETPPEHEVLSYEKFTKRWQEFASSDVTVILDESHFICNATTQRSRAAQHVCAAAGQWIMLSGTPLPNGYRSAAAYAIITGLSRNKTAFWRRFVIEDRSRGFPLILGYREEATLNKWWSQVAKPLKRTGDLKLPSQSIAQDITMSAKLKREFRRVMKERTTKDGEILDNHPKLFAHMRQLTTPARMNTTQSILEGTDEHVVIFYNFNSERGALLKLIRKHFQNRTVYEQSGHASKLPARDEWATMKPSITLAQYQSASQAIELTYASITIYFSPTYSYSNFEQSLGRTRRSGQTKTVLYYMLRVRGSIDDQVWKALKNKQDFSEKLLTNAGNFDMLDNKKG